WPYASPEQCFVGINVTHSTQKPLIQQCAFDWSLAVPEQDGEIFKSNLQGFSAGGFKLFDYAEASKAARIHETQFAPGVEAQNRVRMLFNFGVLWADPKAPGHSEVYDPLGFGLRS